MPNLDEHDGTECHGVRHHFIMILALVKAPVLGMDAVMTLQTYHFLHLIGLIFVFIGFGGLLSSEGAKKAMMWHGIGLVISLVSGFGMVAKYAKLLPPDAPSYYTQPWVLIKFALWLVLGFLPVLAKRRVLAAPLVVLIAAVIGGVLGYIGYFKPVF